MADKNEKVSAALLLIALHADCPLNVTRYCNRSHITECKAVLLFEPLINAFLVDERKIADRDAQIAELEQQVCDFQAAALINIGGVNGPCEVTPEHVERHITDLRTQIATLTRQLATARRGMNLALCADVYCRSTTRASVAIKYLEEALAAIDAPATERRETCSVVGWCDGHGLRHEPAVASAQPFTAEEAQEEVRLYEDSAVTLLAGGVDAEAAIRATINDAASLVHGNRRIAATLRRYSDLLERGDALERVAQAAVDAYQHGTPSQITVALHCLRSVLAMRAEVTDAELLAPKKENPDEYLERLT